MVKMKASYTDQEEFQKVLERLEPIVKSYKLSKNKDGQFKKAYIELKV